MIAENYVLFALAGHVKVHFYVMSKLKLAFPSCIGQQQFCFSKKLELNSLLPYGNTIKELKWRFQTSLLQTMIPLFIYLLIPPQMVNKFKTTAFKFRFQTRPLFLSFSPTAGSSARCSTRLRLVRPALPSPPAEQAGPTTTHCVPHERVTRVSDA